MSNTNERWRQQAVTAAVYGDLERIKFLVQSLISTVVYIAPTEEDVLNEGIEEVEDACSDLVERLASLAPDPRADQPPAAGSGTFGGTPLPGPAGSLASGGADQRRDGEAGPGDRGVAGPATPPEPTNAERAGERAALGNGPLVGVPDSELDYDRRMEAAYIAAKLAGAPMSESVKFWLAGQDESVRG